MKPDARLSSLAKQKAMEPTHENYRELAKKGLVKPLFRRYGEKKWIHGTPDAPGEIRYRLRGNDGHGKRTRAADAVGELHAPAWREGTARALENPADPVERRVASGKLSSYDDKRSGLFCDGCGQRHIWCECSE